MNKAYSVRDYNEDSSDNDGDSDISHISLHRAETNIMDSKHIYQSLSEEHDDLRRLAPFMSVSPDTHPQLSTRRYENVLEYLKDNERPQPVSDANTQTNSNTTNIDENTFVDNNTYKNRNPDNAHQDTETYELEKFDKNAMIIFNHENFWADSPRRGTALDVAALEDTFKQFGFEVETHNDLTRKRLFDVLNEFSRRDYKKYGCICVAVLTHGLDDGYLKAADARYRERDAFACFDCHANPSLVAKPIVFLIQACRGPYAANSVYQGLDVEFDSASASREVRPSDSDMIIFHSSFFGRASVRVVSEGTWFIQTVCQQIKLHASTEHLEKLFRRVRSVVALEKEYEGAKQMPVVTTTLLKKIYLKETTQNNELQLNISSELLKNLISSNFEFTRGDMDNIFDELVTD